MGGGQVRLLDFNTRRRSQLQQKLVCCFKLAVDMVREFVYDTDRPTSIPGKGADGIWCGWVQVGETA